MSDRTLSFKKDCYSRCFVRNELYCIRNYKLFNNVRAYVFKQVNKKRKIKINNVKYNKKSKKKFNYIANIETNIKNINLNENYIKKTIALLKNVVNKVYNFE